MPDFVPLRLSDSNRKHPHDRVCPSRKQSRLTIAVLPQSQRHTKRVFCFSCVCSSSNPITVSLPKRFPIQFGRRVKNFLQPQELCRPSTSNSTVFLYTVLPQSHRHSHLLRPFHSLRETTMSEPNRLPVKSFTPVNSLATFRCRSADASRISRFKHPQLFTDSLRSNAPDTVTVLPQSHRHNHAAHNLMFPFRSRTTNRPNRLPVISTVFIFDSKPLRVQSVSVRRNYNMATTLSQGA